MVGNVIPNTGPNMEHIYDDMSADSAAHSEVDAEKTVTVLREEIKQTMPLIKVARARRRFSLGMAAQPFRTLANPELTLYVFAHLAGQAEVPIPGYYTAFNAYEKEHYALPQEFGQ
jgi:conjugative transfer region lipoprotein (TIGR03751 family)